MRNEKGFLTGVSILASGLALAAVLGLTIAEIAPDRAIVVLGKLGGIVTVAQGCSVFSRGIFDAQRREDAAKPTVQLVKNDGPIALFETPLGPTWFQLNGGTLPELVAESQADVYHIRAGMVQPGDVVLDIGANVGTVTRDALRAGAKLVVAVEPEPTTLECLRRNLQREISSGRVIVVPKGAWDADSTLPLHIDPNPLGSSLVLGGRGARTILVPLVTIDEIVAELRLEKVDFIKMDIEGAESHALLGASQTLRKFHPRMSLELEHHTEDADELPRIARGIWPAYHVEFTPCTITGRIIHPEVALLRP